MALASIALGQSWPAIQWLDPSTAEVLKLDADSLVRVWNGERWATRDTLMLKGIRKVDLRGVDRLMPIRNSDPLHFIAPGTQQVYILEGGMFDRDDSTDHRGYNFDAIQWWRNDTLFSLGGYGFWHTQSILSYYSENTKEWHVLQTEGGPDNITQGVHHFSEKGDKLYVTYSKRVRGSDVFRSEDVWQLSLGSKRWKKVGSLTSETIQLLKSDRARLNLPIGVVMGGERRLLIDLVNNRVDYIDASICDLRFRKNDEFKNGTGTLIGSTFVLDSYFPSSSSLGQSVSFKYDFQEIRNARRNPEEVYQTGWAWWVYLLIGLGAVVLMFITYRLINKLREPFEKGQTMEAEERFFKSLDDLEVKLLRSLLRAEMRGEGLQSGPITEIMGWNDKSWDNQRKWRNNLIKELNKRALDHLNIEELISRERNPKDKRERVYKLDPDGFRLLRDSLHFKQ